MVPAEVNDVSSLLHRMLYALVACERKNRQRRNNTRGCNKVVRRLAELHSSLQLARTSSSRKNPPDGELGQQCSPVVQCSGSRNSALLNYASIRFARGARKNPRGSLAALSRYTREIPRHARACVRACEYRAQAHTTHKQHAYTHAAWCKRPGSKRVIRRISDTDTVFCVPPFFPPSVLPSFIGRVGNSDRKKAIALIYVVLSPFPFIFCIFCALEFPTNGYCNMKCRKLSIFVSF